MGTLTYNALSNIYHFSEDNIDIEVSFSSTVSEELFLLPKILSYFKVIPGRLKINEWDFTISENCSPYFIVINRLLFIYFGKDLPIIQEKCVKNCTKDFKYHTGYSWKDPEKYESYFSIKKVNFRELLFRILPEFVYVTIPDSLKLWKIDERTFMFRLRKS